jgi:DNA segregation ATPase FtsK/SpoIIIE-like protein
LGLVSFGVVGVYTLAAAHDVTALAAALAGETVYLVTVPASSFYRRLVDRREKQRLMKLRDQQREASIKLFDPREREAVEYLRWMKNQIYSNYKKFTNAKQIPSNILSLDQRWEDFVDLLDVYRRRKHHLRSINRQAVQNQLVQAERAVEAARDDRERRIQQSNVEILNIEKHKNYLRSLFGAEEVNLKLTNDAKVDIEVIDKAAKDLNFISYKLKETELLLGHDSRARPITADMKKCPHLLVTGLSGQGKTGLLKCIIRNLTNADIVLCNGFIEDFEGYRIPKLLGEKNILIFLKNILEKPYKRERPFYIIIEELATIKDKELNNVIKELLCIARHYNIYVIGIIQIATKEELKFKSYFNSRCSFKQLDESSYKVALGCNVDGELSNREFYFYSDNLYKGRTYSLTQ